MTDFTFINGKAIIKKGRKIIAKIYDLAVFYEVNKIKSGYSKKYPYTLELKVGSRECESLEDCSKMIEKYAY